MQLNSSILNKLILCGIALFLEISKPFEKLNIIEDIDLKAN